MQDHAKAHTIQNIHKAELDIDGIYNLIRQAQNEAYKLPKSIQDNVRCYLSDLAEEAGKKKPDNSRLRSLMTSLRTVCEGAAGNLTAEGIIGMIGSLLT